NSAPRAWPAACPASAFPFGRARTRWPTNSPEPSCRASSTALWACHWHPRKRGPAAAWARLPWSAQPPPHPPAARSVSRFWPRPGRRDRRSRHLSARRSRRWRQNRSPPRSARLRRLTGSAGGRSGSASPRWRGSRGRRLRGGSLGLGTCRFSLCVRYGYAGLWNCAVGSPREAAELAGRAAIELKIMSNKMWGGRFSERPDAIMEEINVSIDVDRHLYAQDIAASKAHAAMLAAQGIITASDAKNIAKGLDTILSEIGKGSFDFKRALEDIHMNVESRLAELIGPAAGRLHTARSRNDQVATDFRLYVRDTIDETDAALAAFQHALVGRALQHAATVMPGFTHLQTAQPVTYGHHLLAYVEMAARDRGRFADARKRLNESPLGASAFAGTSFAIDRV